MEDNTKFKAQEISLELIAEPDHAVRSHISDDSIDGLTDSIRHFGIISPIVVERVGDHYAVIAGHRRLLASRRARLKTVPCIIREANDTDKVAIRVQENFNRQDVNPVDEAAYIAELKEQHDYSVQQLSELTGLSDSAVRDRLAMIQYDQNILQAIHAEQISPTVAKHLAKIEDKALRDNYLNYAVRSGATATTVRHWAESAKREQLPPEPTDFKAETNSQGEHAYKPIAPCSFCGHEEEIPEMMLFYGHQTCADTIKGAW